MESDSVPHFLFKTPVAWRQKHNKVQCSLVVYANKNAPQLDNTEEQHKEIEKLLPACTASLQKIFIAEIIIIWCFGLGICLCFHIKATVFFFHVASSEMDVWNWIHHMLPDSD